MKIFPELYGFVVFSEQPLLSFMEENDIGRDLLTFMTTNDMADKLTEQGIIVPIFDVPDGLYEVLLKSSNSALDHTQLGVFESYGKLSICGMGYLADFDVKNLKESNKINEFSVGVGLFDLYCSIDGVKEILSLSLKPQS